jgi:hypothetical protein
MKNILSLIALGISTCAFSQGFQYDKVKDLDIKQIGEKFDSEAMLTKDEKKAVNACLTQDGFEFTKDSYYACIKKSMSPIQARKLMALYPMKNDERDNASPAPMKKSVMPVEEEIHPKK